MTVAVPAPDAPHVSRSERSDDPNPRLSHDEWSCGLPANAGPEQRERCENVVAELIVELL